jgi:hypothetical protein
LNDPSKPVLTISPSSINWMRCPHKYQILIAERRYPEWKGKAPVLKFGTAVHAVLYQVYCQGDPESLDNLGTYLQNAFARETYPTQDDRQHEIVRADRLVRLYLKQMDDAPMTVLGTEQNAKFPVERNGQIAYRISARHDLVLVRAHEPDVLIVRDWKVGSNQFLAPEQVWVNMAAARFAHPRYPQIRFEVDALNTDDGCQRITYESSAMKGIVRQVSERVARFIEDQVHDPVPGAECHHCPLEETCPAQTVGINWADLDFE